MPRGASRNVVLVARREGRLWRRSRGGRVALALTFAMAWLPFVLVGLRSGHLRLAAFPEVTALALAVEGVVLPLLSILAGCSLFAGEIEDRTLVPVLCLPITRAQCFWGKLLGLGLGLGMVYVAAFGSVATAAGLLGGTTGFLDYLVVVFFGFLLGVSCFLIGAALGTGGTGRVRAYGAALTAWLVLVFAVDALLLAVVLVTAPPPPETVGRHGHDELSMGTGAGSSQEERSPLAAWWLSIDPVSLLRWSSLTVSPGLSARWNLAPGPRGRSVAIVAIGLSWLFWIALPAGTAARRFRRVSLS